MNISRGTLLAVAAVVAVLAGDAIAQDDDYVDLPSEFYFGRWVPGHRITAYAILNPEQSPERWTSYHYLTNNLRVGIDKFFNHLLYERGDEFMRTVPWSVHVRPSRNLQIGLDSLAYRQWSESRHIPRRQKPGRFPDYWPASDMTSETSDVRGGLSARWVNHSHFRLNPGMARLAYTDTPVVGQGDLLLEGAMSFGRGTEDGRDSVTERTEITTRLKKNTSWQLDLSLQWGATANTNLLLGLQTAYSRSQDDARKNSQLRPDSTVTIFDNNGENLTISYFVAPIISPIDDIYIKARWKQQSVQSKRRDLTGVTSWWDDTVAVNLTIDSLFWRFDRSAASLNVLYLTQGDFRPGALLDDYSDYYAHMLFRRQFCVGISAAYSRYDRPWGTDYDMSATAQAGYGFSSGWELAATSTYRWREHIGVDSHGQTDTVYAAIVSSVATLRWRSYDYEPGRGPGWQADSPFDITFRPLLSRGQARAALEWQLPDWNATKFDGRKPLRASTFLSDQIGYVRLRCDIGLAARVEASAFSWLRYRTDGDRNYHDGKLVLERNDYGMGVTGRPFQWIEFTVSGTLMFDRYDRTGVGETLRLDLRALL